MDNKVSASADARTRRKGIKRCFSFFLLLLLLLGLLPVDTFAAWDGSGDSGNTSGSVVTSGFSVFGTAPEYTIIGYRFSVYSKEDRDQDGWGDKLGNSIDIDFTKSLIYSETGSSCDLTSSYYRPHRSTGSNKKSHIDLYKDYLTYLDTGNANHAPTLGTPAYEDYDDTYLYYNEEIAYTQSDPPQLEEWMDSEQARIIALTYCSANSFDYGNCYIVVEPIFYIILGHDDDGNLMRYALTMAELAVYQSVTVAAARTASGYSDTNGWTNIVPYNSSVNVYMNSLGRYTSAIFGRWLYATGEYEGVFQTEAPPEWSLVDDATKNVPTVLLSGHASRNTAENILKYQIGMAIYTEDVPTNLYSLTVDPNGGTWTDTDSKIYTDPVTFDLFETYTKEIPNPTRENHTFLGWTVTPTDYTSWLDGTTYTQGAGHCTITAQWELDTTKSGTIQITKVDQFGNPVAGAGFTATDTSGNAYTFEETDSDGLTSLVVPYGTYTITETSFPTGYTSGSQTSWTVTIDADNAETVQEIKVENTLILGTITIQKADQFGNPVAGAVFQAVHTNGTVYTFDATDSNGCATLTDLPIGVYTITETTIPDGYTSGSTTSWTVTITSDNAATVQVVDVTNPMTLGSIQIHKLDQFSNPVAGAVFTATDANGKTYTSTETNASGYATISDLPHGVYTITETTIPTGYTTGDTTSWTVTIAADNVSTVQTVEVENIKILGGIQIHKVDQFGNPVAGAVFQAAHTNGTMYTFSATNSSGYATLTDLPIGVYTITETTIPDGYTTGSTTSWTVTITSDNAATVQVVDVTNPMTLGSIQIHKVDQFGNPVAGAVFQAKDDNGNTYTSTGTDANGYATISDLPHGVYTITEITIPNGYASGSTASWTVTISASNVGTVQTVEAENIKILGGIQIHKVDQFGNPVAGAVFQAVHTNGTVYTFDATNSGGYATLTDLPIGVYTITETTIPDGYTSGSTTSWTIEITSDNAETVQIIDVTNNMTLGSIQIHKVDQFGNPVAGAVFQAKDANGKTYTSTETDANGYATISDLPHGVYTITETTVPTGYTTGDTTSWTVTISASNVGTTQSVEAENVKILGGIQIQKETNTGSSKGGWVFDLYVDANCTTKITSVTTNDAGVATITNIEPGTYYLKEQASTSEYWACDTSVKTVVVEANAVTSVSVTNTHYGRITINKTMSDSTSPEGWEFVITDSSGTVVGSYTMEADGSITTDLLLPGTYTVTETVPTDTDYLPQTSSFTVTVTGGNTATVSFVNQKQPKGSILVEKFVNVPQRFDGVWLIGLFADELCTELISYNFTRYYGDADENGYPITSRLFEDLVVGTYYIRELTPNWVPSRNFTMDLTAYYSNMLDSRYEYWIPDDTVYKVTVTEDATSTVQITNTFGGKIQINKTSTDGSSVEGITFMLLDTNLGIIYNKTGMPYYYITDENGSVTTGLLTPGTYYVRERTPSGYMVVGNNPLQVTVIAGTTVTAEFVNTPKLTTGDIQIHKVTNTGNNLDGWYFDIYSDETCTTLVGECVTDETGYATYADLDPGTYYVRERTNGSDYWTFDTSVHTVTVTAGETAELEVTNTHYGRIQITKVINGDANTETWSFQIADESGTVVATLTIRGAGSTTSGNLLPGTYTVTEIIPSDSKYQCITTNPVEVTVTAGANASVSFTNALKAGGIAVTKHTNTGANLDGWIFDLYSDANCTQHIATQTTTGGVAYFIDLDAGTYYVRERSNGDSYWYCDTSVHTVVVAADETTTLTVTNTHYGKIQIDKIMSDGSSPADWQFQVINTSGTVVGTYTMDSTGTLTTDNLLPGTYTVQEIIPEDSLYECITTNPTVVTVVAGESVNAGTFINDLKSGGITITKKTNTDANLDGWIFHLYRDEACTDKVGTYTTDADGVISISGLMSGTYYLQEQAEGSTHWSDYWSCNTDVQTIVVNPGATTSLTVENTHYGRIFVEKLMSDNTSPKGWTFIIKDSLGREYTYETDENGYITSVNLMPGTYTVTEMIDTDNSLYYCDGDITRTITVIAGQTASVTYINALRSGTISIEKVNFEGEYLAGAKFLLEWSNDGGVTWTPVSYNGSGSVTIGGCSTVGLVDGCLVTNASGIVAFDDLHPGLQYRVTELEAPEGYILLADTAYEGGLPITGLTVALTVHNNPAFILPATGGPGIHTVAFFGMMLITVAFVLGASQIAPKADPMLSAQAKSDSNKKYFCKGAKNNEQEV